MPGFVCRKALAVVKGSIVIPPFGGSLVLPEAGRSRNAGHGKNTMPFA